MAGRAARASTTIPSIRPGSSPSASDANHPTLTPKVRMLGYDWPRFHAAVNDLPAALLFVTVLFDIADWLTKRARPRSTSTQRPPIRPSGAGTRTRLARHLTNINAIADWRLRIADWSGERQTAR